MLASHGTTNQKAGSSNLSGRTIFSITWRRCGREGRARARCSAGPEAGGRSAPPLGSSPLPWHFCAGSAGDLPAGSVADGRRPPGRSPSGLQGKIAKNPGVKRLPGASPPATSGRPPGYSGCVWSAAGLQRLHPVGRRAAAARRRPSRRGGRAEAATAASGRPPDGSGAAARAGGSASPKASSALRSVAGSPPLPWHFCAGSAGDLPASGVDSVAGGGRKETK